MKDLIKTIKEAIQIALILVSYLGIMTVGYIIGKAKMHEELTQDMKRNQESGIPCRTASGKMYLYTFDTTYIEWERKRKGKNND